MDNEFNAENARSAVSISRLLIEAEDFQGQQDAQARLFANGQQKCVVIISVQARNANNEVVTLPDDLNINVVPYTSASGNWASNAIPPAAGILPFPNQLSTTGDVGGDNAIPDSKTPIANIQQFRRYVSFDAIPEGTTLQFAARVKLAGAEYISNQRDVPYGDVGQNGRFNSSIRLRSVKPPQYATYNGGLVITEPTEVFSGLIENYTTKVHNLYLNLRYPGSSFAVSILKGATTADSSLHENKATAFGGPGSATALKNVPSTNQLGRAMNQALSTIRSPRPGAITIAVAMYSRVSELFAARQTSHISGGMDVYGNPLRFAVTLTSEHPQRDPWVYRMSIDWAGAAVEGGSDFSEV